MMMMMKIEDAVAVLELIIPQIITFAKNFKRFLKLDSLIKKSFKTRLASVVAKKRLTIKYTINHASQGG